MVVAGCTGAACKATPVLDAGKAKKARRLVVDTSRCGGLGVARPGRYSERGFTLIEVLLATVLLAAGLALAFATLRASIAVVERGEAMAARSDRMRAVEGFLRRRLAGALPMSFALDPSSGQPLRFVGESDRIRFVADLPHYLGRGGPHLHDIAVFGDGEARGLGVSFSMVLAGETVQVAQPRRAELLADGLSEIRIRYRGFDDEGRLGEWRDRWEKSDILPLQVSVEIVGAGGEAWPPMVVALPQSTATGGGLFGGVGSGVDGTR
jgi:general secretion pathway protein J